MPSLKRNLDDLAILNAGFTLFLLKRAKIDEIERDVMPETSLKSDLVDFAISNPRFTLSPLKPVQKGGRAK